MLHREFSGHFFGTAGASGKPFVRIISTPFVKTQGVNGLIHRLNIKEMANGGILYLITHVCTRIIALLTRGTSKASEGQSSAGSRVCTV